MKKLLTALFLVALCSSLAMATVPDPTQCSIVPLLGPVGQPQNQVAFLAPGNLSGTTITITVRNNTGGAIANATVSVAFNSQIRTCSTASHTATTNTQGVCTISLRGGGCLSATSGGCVITANGVEIRNLRFVRSPDNGSDTASLPDGTVSVVDFVKFADEFKGVVAVGCHDYDNDNLCNVVDFPYFGDAFKGAMTCQLAK
jgi:hypothetical protein